MQNGKWEHMNSFCINFFVSLLRCVDEKQHQIACWHTYACTQNMYRRTHARKHTQHITIHKDKASSVLCCVLYFGTIDRRCICARESEICFWFCCIRAGDRTKAEQKAEQTQNNKWQATISLLKNGSCAYVFYSACWWCGVGSFYLSSECYRDVISWGDG